MTRDVTFGKADTNGDADSDDASEEGVEELRQQVEDLRQDLLDEQVARKRAEKQVEEIRDEFENLREQIQRDDSPGGEVDVVEIEWKARNQPYTEMTSNVERAVKVWEGLPNYGSSPRDNLTLTYDQLRRAISDIDRRPKNEVHTQTVKRVPYEVEGTQRRSRRNQEERGCRPTEERPCCRKGSRLGGASEGRRRSQAPAGEGRGHGPRRRWRWIVSITVVVIGKEGRDVTRHPFPVTYRFNKG